MKCELAKAHFMDYLYEEMEEGIRRELETHLASCPICRDEVAGLQGARSRLQQLPPAHNSEQLVFLPAGRSFSAWWRDFVAVLPQPRWARIGLALSAAAICFLVIASLANLHIWYAEKAFHLQMGLRPAAETALSETEVAALLSRMRAENAQLVAQILASHDVEQKAEMNRTLALFAQEIDKKRDNDLRLIGRGLEEIHTTTNQQFGETNEVLKQLMRNVSLQKR